MSAPLPKEWVEALTLTERRPPELYFPTDSFTDGPHAGSLRAAFDRLGLAAVFCIEDVPTIGFLVLEDDEDHSTRIDEVHHALWNQGLMTLLLVLSSDVLRAYSLGRRPQVRQGVEGSDRRLVRTFDRVAHALELRDLVLGIESGRWWREHEDALNLPNAWIRYCLTTL